MDFGHKLAVEFDFHFEVISAFLWRIDFGWEIHFDFSFNTNFNILARGFRAFRYLAGPQCTVLFYL